MPKYRVTLTTAAATYITVEAEDEEAAIDAAYDEAPMLCAQCAGWNGPGVELGEWETDPRAKLEDIVKQVDDEDES